jgi:D-alanine-D-alanine ligase
MKKFVRLAALAAVATAVATPALAQQVPVEANPKAKAHARILKPLVLRGTTDLPPLEGPLIVKPNYEGSSKGITAASVVRSEHELRTALARCLTTYPDGALVEPFIEGTDMSVGWVEGLGWLPAIAYEYDAPVYSYDLKHVTPQHVRYRLVPLGHRLGDAAARAFEALGVRGFGRADFRITPRGEIVFLELNPLPSLADGELFAAAEAMGSSADEMLGCIVASARAVPSSRAA